MKDTLTIADVLSASATHVVTKTDQLPLKGDARFRLCLDLFAWNMSTPVDPAMVIFQLGSNGRCRKCEDFIFWKNPGSEGIGHTGDRNEYTFGGEEVEVSLGGIPADVERVVFAVTTDSDLALGHNLSSMQLLRLSIVLRGRQRDLADYRETEMQDARVMQVAILSRTETGWVLDMTAQRFEGDLRQVCESFGLGVED